MAGAGILRKHYRLDAVAVSGAAAYVVNAEERFVATFGKVEADTLVAVPDAFHCWVQCSGYAIDFMSPVFPENLLSSGFAGAVPRRMFQRPLADISSISSMASDPEDGAFCLLPSQERTEAMVRNFSAKAANADLASICAYWYRRPPERIDEHLDMQNDLGAVARLALQGPQINGAW